jgi:hypothetical protein
MKVPTCQTSSVWLTTLVCQQLFLETDQPLYTEKYLFNKMDNNDVKNLWWDNLDLVDQSNLWWNKLFCSGRVKLREIKEMKKRHKRQRQKQQKLHQRMVQEPDRPLELILVPPKTKRAPRYILEHIRPELF